MLRYTLKRILSALLVLFFVSLITFVVISAIPGDRAILALGIDATEESVEALRSSMGLDKPFFERYFSWLISALRFDLGVSDVYGERVGSLILSRLPVTFSLALFSIFIASVLSALLALLCQMLSIVIILN